MEALQDRLEVREGTVVVKGAGIAAADVLRRLEAGQSPAELVADLRLTTPDLIAVLAREALGDVESAGPGLVHSPPRLGYLSAVLTESRWGPLLEDLSQPFRLALLAGLLQIHDLWDESHAAAQRADDLGERTFSGYWHGVAHRREPDSANASYWFRRVGRNPVDRALGRAATSRLGSGGSLPRALVTDGIWDPLAFVGLCGDGRPASGTADLLRKLQRMEMATLLAETMTAAGLRLDEVGGG